MNIIENKKIIPKKPQFVEALTPNLTVFGDRSDKEVESHLRLNAS